MTTPTDTADALGGLLFGRDPLQGLVAVEVLPGEGCEEAHLFIRNGAVVERRVESFRPFFWAESEALLQDLDVPFDLERLQGSNPLRVRARFATWKAMDAALKALKARTGANPSDPSAPFFLLNDPVQQYLMDSGRTLFKGMPFAGLRRMQLDIETYTEEGYDFSNAEREGDRILAIALADETGWVEVLSGQAMTEKELLQRFVAIVQERDPDVLEGHNLFQFDLPYLFARAKRHRVKMTLGRDGSVPSSRPSRFSAGERTIQYPRCRIFGRAIQDTYFMAQLYDVSHRSLPGFGLKEVARHFGLAREDRAYIEGSEIAATFRRDPARVMAYVEDDVRETRALSDLFSPVYFAQAQILPYDYQNVGVRGSATKIDALLLREYGHAGHAVPRPDAARAFQGGYTDIFFTGVARPVHHCDVRSLYPSIMLKEKLGPASDELGVFLQMLDRLRAFRLEAKRRMQQATREDERLYEDALQSTFKILINSFYGYLGFGMARFSDFDAAERTTAEGRRILQHMIDWLNEHGAQPIEIDTDGIYFVPPTGRTGAQEQAFREGLQQSLPEGIEVEFDGEFEAMFSYKMKNYALLAADGEIVLKGAALKSRGLEPFQRDFMLDLIRLILEGRTAEAPALRETYRKAIAERAWPIARLAKTERLTESPASYAAKQAGTGHVRNAAQELARTASREYRSGDAIAYYVTGEKKSVAVHAAAKLMSESDPARRDENVPYYLAKLDALAKKFEEFTGGAAAASPGGAQQKELDL